MNKGLFDRRRSQQWKKNESIPKLRVVDLAEKGKDRTTCNACRKAPVKLILRLPDQKKNGEASMVKDKRFTGLQEKKIILTGTRKMK